MNTQPSIETRLWDYIDGHTGPEEKSAIEQLIDSNIEWRNKYHELLEVHQLMSKGLELDEPSMRFTQNVMEDIAKYHIAPAAHSYINKRIIWGIFAFFILTIVGFLIYSLGQMNWSSSGSGSGSLPFNIDTSRISSFNFSKVFNNSYTTVFLMINAVLGLVLLDMYLNKKKNNYKKSIEAGSWLTIISLRITSSRVVDCGPSGSDCPLLVSGVIYSIPAVILKDLLLKLILMYKGAPQLVHPCTW
ncbi:hypothetical protein [Paraflavitalea speifideaquila]|uniref:anti-sigma factor family protein n=1 Tax=Paraflavitalea speifideaquila TaxID=3076558 RepID=UPI0028ECD1B3|nr:hypothetical protein [Paraflavitalea speifideiaquila]